MANTAENNDEEKIEMTKEELEELIVQKVEERMRRRERRNNSRLNNQRKDEISRRSFLKKLGAGAIGLGALSLTPTSALDIRSDNLKFYGGSGETSTDFEIGQGGNIEAIDSVMSMGAGKIKWGDYEIRPSQNENDGLAVRANSNPSGSDPIFTVESSGGATRFAVTQSNGAYAYDELYENASSGPGSGERVATRTWAQNNVGGKPPIYGDGSDGQVTRSSNGSENGIINATTYTVQSGATRNVTNGVLVVFATESINIYGTIDGSNVSGTGNTAGLIGATGSGGHSANYGSNGGNGGPGAGGGGGGMNDASNESTPGNDANKILTDAQERGLRILNSGTYSRIYDLNVIGGSGGFNGGGGVFSSDGPGGSGGNGSAVILLCAPEINFSGTIRSDGGNGSDGGDNSSGGGGGGGGGGSGGLVIFAANSINDTGSISVSGGVGGNGGNGGDGGNGGSGGDGISGEVIKIRP